MTYKKPFLRPLGNDWFLIDWADVWQATKLAPPQVPGAVPAPDQHFAPRDEFGARPLYPHRVHLSHLRLLGYDYEAILSASMGADNYRDTPLRSHQIAAVAYIRSRRGTLLADEMRVGKTGSIMYAHNPTDGCMFVIGPLAARAVWHEWAARRFGYCADKGCSICARVAFGDYNICAPSFTALEGRNTEREADLHAKVIFCHFAIVPAWREIFNSIKIGTLVVDEVHLPQSGMQNRNSVTAESIRWLNTVAKRAVFASGSPLWNKPKGLWPILDMLTPGAFGGYWDFARRYCDAKPTAYGWQAQGSSNEAELSVRLQQVMLRRTWKEISPTLPAITRSVEIVGIPMSARDRTEELAARIRSAAGNMQTVVGDLARLRKMYAEHKVNAAVTKAQDALESGNSVVIWTWHKDIALQISRLFKGTVQVIDGDKSPTEREAIIEDVRFDAAIKPVALIATMGALATAVNLSFARTEIFVELDWNPDSIAQAEMRCYDGKQAIGATFLVADCDVEQKLADALLVKLEVKAKLGVSAGVGSVADVLRGALGIEDARTLSMLAFAVFAEVGE
jgi:hypothetical protein